MKAVFGYAVEQMLTVFFWKGSWFRRAGKKGNSFPAAVKLTDLVSCPEKVTASLESIQLERVAAAKHCESSARKKRRVLSKAASAPTRVR